MSTPDYDANFYNNIATVALALMVTKIVSHGFRRVRGKRCLARELRWLHGVAIVGAMLSAAVALLATFRGSHLGFLHVLAWFGVVVSAICLGVEVIVEARFDAGKTSKSPRHQPF